MVKIRTPNGFKAEHFSPFSMSYKDKKRGASILVDKFHSYLFNEQVKCIVFIRKPTTTFSCEIIVHTELWNDKYFDAITYLIGTAIIKSNG